jgi:uncharacterized membrane protein
VTWYEFFLFVHITAAVIWLGGAFTFQMYGAVVRRGGDPGEIALFAGRAGHLSERMFVPASLTVILAGIALMINGNWDWGQLWVIFALVTFAASFLTGVLVISPMAKRIPVVGPTTPEGQALIERLFTILRIDLCFMYAIVFAMVVKPTTDDGWIVAIGAALLVVLTVVFLAPLRTGSGRPASSTATD